MKTKIMKFCAWLMAAALAFAGAGAYGATVQVTDQTGLDNALSAAKSGDVIQITQAGEYELNKLGGSGYTLEATVAGVTLQRKKYTTSRTENYVSSCTGLVTLKNIAWDMTVNAYYPHFKNIHAVDCTFTGLLFAEETCIFEHCTFNAIGTEYNLWCYHGPVTFTDCTFNGAGKFLHLYNESNYVGDQLWEVTVDGCTFNSSKKGKAAVNVKARCNSSAMRYDLVVKNCKIAEGGDNFPEASASDTLIVFNKFIQLDQISASVPNVITLTYEGDVIYKDNTVLEVAKKEVEVVTPTVSEEKGITQEIINQIVSNTEVTKVEETGLQAALAGYDELKEKEAVVKVELTEVKEETGVLTYEIKPVVKGEGETPDEDISVKVAGKPITFRVPLTDAFTKFAKVTHRGTVDEISHVEVLGAAGARYVELTFNHFSEVEFDPELAFPGLPETAVKVVDGFYQSAPTYTASTDFYIVSKAGLEYLSDLVNTDRRMENTVGYNYLHSTCGTGFSTTDNPFLLKTVHLLVDVDLTGEDWNPIGYTGQDYPAHDSLPEAEGKNFIFHGNFYGGNHKITGLRVVNTASTGKKYCAGLFGRITSAVTIRDLTIENVYIRNGGWYSGAVAGYVGSSSTQITNVKVTGDVDIVASSYAAGLVGYSSAKFQSCAVDANANSVIAATAGHVGGVVGFASANSSFDEVAVKTVKVENRSTGSGCGVGGIAGFYADGIKVTDCEIDGVEVQTGATDKKSVGLVLGCNNETNTKLDVIEDLEVKNATGAKVGSGNAAGPIVIGSNIGYDENGKIKAGTFESLPASAIAEGFVPEVDPESGTISVVTDPITGSGTEADPYVISDLKGLKLFRDRVNAGNTYQGKFVKLGDDIDLETVENWEPIGTVQHLFFGTFDGDGNTIRNLKITSGDDKGLFSDGNQPFPGCTIRNLTVDGASVTGGKQCGTIIGGLYCVATLDNVHVKNASVVCTGKRIGGLVSHGYVTFNGCSFEGEVKSTGDTSVGGQVGGLLGAYSVSATNCRVVADVTGSKEVGGIVGNGCESCTFIGNYVKGTITSDVSWWGATGGIAGWGGGVGGTFTIKDNYFDGEVKVAGVKMDAPIIGSLNTTSGSDVEGGDAAAKAAIIEGNSWNTDYYSADIKACAVNADRMPDGNPTQAEIDAVVAAFGKTEPRNNNLVGSVKDLEYVGGGVVEIAAGSVIAEMTPDEIKAKIVEDDPTKTVEITVDGKVVVTENVAEVDGTKYPTLDAALAAATDGATLTLLKDVADIGSKSLNGITFDGNSNKITGASALYCGAEKETTIKNVVFENIHNANSKQSAIYGEGFKTGSITITGCTFDNIDWDAIQIVPADSGVTGSVTIKGNVFRHTDDSLPQLRYIHIQNGGFWTPTLVVTATDNQMYDCEKDITAICVAGFAKGEGSNYSGNYISDVSMIDCSEIQTVKIVDFYPMRTQPTVDVDDLDPKAVFDFTPITTADELVSAINACTTAKPELYFRGDLTAMSPVVLENPNITKIWWYGVATSGTPGFTFRAPSMTTSVPLYLLNNAKIVLDGAFVANGKCEIVSGVYSAESFSGSFEISGGTFNQDISAFVDHRIGRVVDNGDGTWSFEAYTAETALEDGKPFAVASKYYFAHLEEAAQESANIVVIGDACDDADFGAVSPTITLDNMAAFTGSLKSQNQIKINNSKYTEPKAINFTSVTCPVFKYGSSQSWLGEVKIGGGEIGRMEIDSTYTSTTLSGDLKVDEILIATYWYDNKEQKAALTITGGTYGKIQFRANASSEPVGSLPNDAVDLKITNGTFGFDPTAYVDPEISDVVERTTDPVTWEVIEKTSIAAVVLAGGSATNEYKKLSKALEAAQPGGKVILLADTDEENVPLNPGQEIVLNGHEFTGTVDQTHVPEGYDAMVKTPDGRVFSAPAKVEVPIGESSVIKVRMLDTAENLATLKQNGRPLWANKALGIENDFVIKPQVERLAVGSKTVTIKSNIPDSVLEAAAQQRDGVSVKFQLAKKVGNAGTYVQFGEKQPKPEFTVEADKQEVQTFWKIQVFFEEEY